MKALFFTLFILASPLSAVVAPSVSRIVIVTDQVRDDAFKLWSLSQKGLKSSEEKYNVFVVNVDLEKEKSAIQHIEQLAMKGFDLFIGLGPRSNDYLCNIARKHRTIKVSLSEGQCETLPNVRMVKFRLDALGMRIAEALSSYAAGNEAHMVWVEEESTPDMDDIRQAARDHARKLGFDLKLSTVPIDEYQLVSMAAQVQSRGYAGVFVSASARLQGLWKQAWTSDALLILSGPGPAYGARLVKRFDRVIEREISSVVNHRFYSGLALYSFEDGGVELEVPQGKGADLRWSRDLGQLKIPTINHTN